LRLNRKDNFTITAVFEDAPENTQIKPNLLISYNTFVKRNGPRITILKPHGNGMDVLPMFCCVRMLIPPWLKRNLYRSLKRLAGADMKKFNAAVTYHLQPLKDIHLYSHYMGEPETNGDGKTTYLLLGIALFIVVIAWVNYVNLATARAITRAKEVGIRKAIGSQKKQLVVQFLAESVLLNGLALALALVIMLVSVPGFNSITGQHLSFSLFIQADFWLGMASLLSSAYFSRVCIPHLFYRALNR
jgi:putative ABC transport system permease protein